MKSMTFLEGALLAMLLALAGGALATIFTPLIGPRATRLLLGGVLGAAYLLYLLRRRARRGGRALTLASWSLVVLASALVAPSLLAYALTLLLCLSSLRTLLCARGPLAALADVLLAGVAFAAAAWAWLATGSVVVALWCAGLVQAAHVWLPARQARARTPATHDFDGAARAAEQALARLAS